MMLVAAVAMLLAAANVSPPVRLDVPLVVQARERCGPAALAMVLRYYGAAGAALEEAERAWHPAFRGALVTDLAEAARRAGFLAAIETPGADSLAAWLSAGVPPVLLYDRGAGPVSRGHYGVVVAWDPARGEYTLHDGGARPRRMKAGELERRWRAAGGRALIVRRAP